ncbi:glycine betaine/proline transport system substrate-binding protein [Sinosporangium album]|uniref:Glycine betaine/proline transport system substrate-binding protein n=1 Tax=Sinosporangium album TaxID=504805 RepID=A0A1G7VBB2_9ACTN|nr:ABC transporter substrate-binding protein [Sinosporangium album]SDG56858.1 glycine betaine/proline transport system substrate-binding protein [Sinosporangium album]
MATRGKRAPASAAVLVLLLTGCSGDGAQETTGAVSKRVVRLALNPWIGYEASAAVLTYLLEKELGYQVEKKRLNEAKSWEGIEDGEVDVIIENWGREAEKKEYIEDKKVAVSAGTNGNKGVIGWYIPQWMADRYPDITDWRNLNKYAHLFKTAKSGEQGQFLSGDPSFVTNDNSLIKNLDLNYKVVHSGSEAALIKAAKRASEEKTPLLMYFYEPQWLFTQVELVKVNLPPYSIGCDTDPKKIACDYPPYLLDKIVSKRFADTGGKAYELVRNFTWTNEHQNSVADDITNENLLPEDAAKKWVEANKIVWKPWLPR